MDTSRYNQDINRKLDLLDHYKDEVFEASIRLASEVITVANRRNDKTLRALCNYYIARYYYNLRNCAETIRYLEKTIGDATADNAWLELCWAMSLLGNTFLRQGNFANAMQAFSTVISIAEKNIEQHPEFSRILLASYNDLSAICYSIGDYPMALDYELAADRYFFQIESEDYYPVFYIHHLTNILKAYIMLADTTNAGDVITQIDNYSLNHESINLEPYISICHILWNDYTGNHKWDDVYYDRLNNFFRNRSFSGAYTWEFFYLLEQMSNRENYQDYFRSLVSKMESFLDFTDLFGQKLILSNIKLNFYERNGMEKQRREELERFREYATASDQAQNHAMSIVIGIRTINLLDAELSATLDMRSNVDELTGLPNRKAFNDMADHYFERCLANGQNLALVMMTIDAVKKINDMYGYTIGDRCLTELSNVLKRYASDRIFPARYVGAEFVLLFEGFRDEEVLHYLRDINHDIVESISREGLPPFTLAEGVCSHVPQRPNKIWDYTSCADLGLIKAMQLGTGQAILVHHAPELAVALPVTLGPEGKLFSKEK